MFASLPRIPLLASALLVALAACGGNTNHGTGGGTSSSTSQGGAPSSSTSSSTSSGQSSTSSSTSGQSSSSTSTTSSSSTSTSSSTSSSGGLGTAFPFPKAIWGGGPTIAAPKVISVTFPGNTFAADLATFGAGVASSSYWSAVSADLTCGGASACVGPGPAGTAAVSPVAIGSSYADSVGPNGNTLQTYLKSVIAALPSSMAPQPDNLYVFYVPSTTTVTLDGSPGCTAFGGYHNVMNINGAPVYYAIVVDCNGRGSLDQEQALTFSSSHEIAEAASDPAVGGSGQPSGYALDESLQGSFPWITMGLGELGDLCVDMLGLDGDVTTEGGFTVQRIWSITDAATGTKDPCVPGNGQVYFNAFPTVSAVIVDVGKSQTFEIDALALGNEPTWTVAVEDATVLGQPDQYLSFSIQGGNNTSGVGAIAANSGDHIQATVTMLKDPASATNGFGWALGLVLSYAGLNPQASTRGHFWPFLVLTPALATQYGITMTESLGPHVVQRLARGARPRVGPRVDPRVSRSRFLDPLLPLFR